MSKVERGAMHIGAAARNTRDWISTDGVEHTRTFGRFLRKVKDAAKDTAKDISSGVKTGYNSDDHKE